MTSETTETEPEGEGSARQFLQRQLEMFREGFSFSGFERDLLALNLGGSRFLDISGVSGADSISDGRAAVYADLDNDGDHDVFLRAMHGPAHLFYRNELGSESHYLRVALEGTESGKDAFGAVVRVPTSKGVLARTKSGGDGFLSQADPRLLFGLEQDEAVDWIEVTWPGGRRERFPGAAANSSLLLVEGDSVHRVVQEHRLQLPEPLPGDPRRWNRLTFRAGAALPPTDVTTLSGERIQLPAIIRPGRPTLVNFWATWCIPCRAEMPELQRLHNAGTGKGLQVIGVSLDRPEDTGKIPRFLEELGVTYPVYVGDPEGLGQIFASPDIPIPISLLVNEESKVVEVFTGWDRETRHTLEALVNDSGGSRGRR